MGIGHPVARLGVNVCGLSYCPAPGHFLLIGRSGTGGKTQFVTAGAHGIQAGASVSVTGTPDNDGVDLVLVDNATTFHFKFQAFVAGTTKGWWV